jgi:hypothetical protein
MGMGCEPFNSIEASNDRYGNPESLEKGNVMRWPVAGTSTLMSDVINLTEVPGVRPKVIPIHTIPSTREA